MRPTDHELRAAVERAGQLLAGGTASPYPRELYPELDRRRSGHESHAFAAQAEPPAVAPHARPIATSASAAGALSPENVARWSGELGFTRAARIGRVTRADD
jgi:hypothetical protein